MKKQAILAALTIIFALVLCGSVAATDTAGSSPSDTITTDTTPTQNSPTNDVNTQDQGLNQVDTEIQETNSASPSPATNEAEPQVNSAPNKETANTVDPIISGVVLNCKTHEPFPGVTIKVNSLNGDLLASAITDQNGSYSTAFLSSEKVFKVTASYPGHHPATQEVTVKPSSDPNDPNLYGTANFELGVNNVYVDDNWAGLPSGTVVYFPGDPNPHIIGTDAFAKIQDGITNVNVGGTVNVAAGIYPENVSVTQALILHGAKWGVDARTRDVTSGESIIQSPGGFLLVFINADNVTIDGFTVRGHLGPGIYNLYSNHTTIQNNYITDNSYAMDLGGDDLVVKFNWIYANNRVPYGYNGNGLVIDRDNSNALIQYNLFEDNMSHSILTTTALNPNPSTTHYHIDISHNTIVNAGLTAIQLAGVVSDIMISDNTIINAHASKNPAYAYKGAINLHQYSSVNGPVYIIENFIDSRFWEISFQGYLNGNTVVIHFNNLAHGDTGGIRNGSVDSGFIDAENNWWGSNNNPSSKILGNVNVSPWIVLGITAMPGTIYNGQTSTITADLNHNWDGGSTYSDTSALGHVPDGIPVTFSFNPALGTLNPPPGTSIPTINGIATSIFTDSAVGTAHFYTSADQQIYQHFASNTAKTPADVLIRGAANMTVKKTSNSPVNVGQIGVFTITLYNNGPDSATSVRVTDLLPKGFTAGKPSQGSYNGIIWNVGTLAKGATATLTLSGLITSTMAGKTIQNTATETQNEHSNLPKTATASIYVPEAVMDITKTVDNARPMVNDIIHFTMIVQNHGPDTAVDVNVQDKMPPGLNFVSYTASYGSYDPETGIWHIGDLPNGAVATITITSTVTGTGSITNEARVTSLTYDPNIEGTTATVTIFATPDVPVGPSANAATVPMQPTGTPITILVLAVIMVLFGVLTSKRR